MGYVVIDIGQDIADDDHDCQVIAVLGERAGTDRKRDEAEIIEEELDGGGAIEVLWGDERPAPGLWLIECHYWAEQDYWGEWDGGIEWDDGCRWQDGPEARARFEAVLRPIAERAHAHFAEVVHPTGQTCSLKDMLVMAQDIRSWADIAMSMTYYAMESAEKAGTSEGGATEGCDETDKSDK